VEYILKTGIVFVSS